MVSLLWITRAWMFHSYFGISLNIDSGYQGYFMALGSWYRICLRVTSLISKFTLSNPYAVKYLMDSFLFLHFKSYVRSREKTNT